MRTFLLIGLAAGMSAVPAYAQATDTDREDVAIDGRVAPICILGAPSQATVFLGELVATSGTRVGRVRSIGPNSVTLPSSFCNFGGSIATIEASALVETTGGTTAPATGFTRSVNYSASVSAWGGETASTTTSATRDGSSATATGTSSVQTTPRLADLSVTLSTFTVPGDALLVSGIYSGLVRVTLGPSTVSQ